MMKLQYNGEIYKVPKCPKSYEELLKLTTDKFGDRLPQSIEFCYTDADNDTITVSNELDYTNALSFMETTKGTAMKFTIRQRAGHTNTGGETKGDKEIDLETTMPVPREHSAKSESKRDEVDQTLAVSRLDETVAMQVPSEVPKETTAGNSIEVLSSRESPRTTAACYEKEKSSCILCEKHCQHLKPLAENDKMYQTLGETAAFVKSLFEKFMAEREASALPQQIKKIEVSAEPKSVEAPQVPQPPKEQPKQVEKVKPVNDTLLMDSGIEAMMNSSFLRRCRVVESNEKGWTCVFCNKTFSSETVRYCCTVCEQFDLCVACEEKVGENHEHPLLKLRRKLVTPLEIEIKSVEVPTFQIPATTVSKSEKEAPAPVQKVPVKPIEKKPVPKDAKLAASLVNLEPTDKLVCSTGMQLELGIRLRNTGNVDWTPEQFVLQCIEGEYKGVDIPCKKVVAVKEEELFIFEIEAPERLGKFEVSYRMYCTELGKHFGPRAIYSIETYDNIPGQDQKKTGAISVRTIERKGDSDSTEPIKIPTYDNTVIEKAKQFQGILGGRFEDYCAFLQGYKTENRSIESLMDEWLSKKVPPYPVARPQQPVYQQVQQQQQYRTSALAEEDTPY